LYWLLRAMVNLSQADCRARERVKWCDRGPKMPRIRKETIMVSSGTLAPTIDYTEVARRPLQAEECALVLVDIQEKLLPPIFERERVVRNSQLLIRLAQLLHMPILWATQYEKGLGKTVPEIASLLEGVTTPLEKLDFNCFNNERFCSAARALPGNRNTVVLCGIEAHICITQTALGALSMGYLVHVASDAVSSRGEWNFKHGLQRMRDAGAVISTTEMIIYELLRQSGTPAFKEMLKHLK
jgi:nicotinamidase-related amidase